MRTIASFVFLAALLFVASVIVGIGFRLANQKQPCRCGTVETGAVEYSVGGSDAQ